MSGAVIVSRDGAVARVTLSRPEVRNAFNAELIADLHDAFTTLAGEPPEALRAVVLAGEGAAFCAGADVAWMRASAALSVEDNEADARRMAEMLATIDACPVPVVARVHGAALGGGMGLCAVADVTLAHAGTVFGFTETKLGILPAVISPFVIARIGEGQARALFPAASASAPSGRCASAWSMRCWPMSRRSTIAWPPWSGSCSAPAPPPPGPPRPSSATSGACPRPRSSR